MGPTLLNRRARLVAYNSCNSFVLALSASEQKKKFEQIEKKNVKVLSKMGTCRGLKIVSFLLLTALQEGGEGGERTSLGIKKRF